MGTAAGVLDPTDVVVADDVLLDRCRAGDARAFEILYCRHRPSARRIADRCTRSAADADDAVAEGFARVFAALPRLAGRRIVFQTYLYAAVRNAATDAYRRRSRLDLRARPPEGRGEVAAEDEALRSCERELVGAALAMLPARWRAVLWLTAVEGLSPAEVSRRIGVNPNALVALAYRSRQGLRQAYLRADPDATPPARPVRQ